MTLNHYYCLSSYGPKSLNAKLSTSTPLGELKPKYKVFLLYRVHSGRLAGVSLLFLFWGIEQKCANGKTGMESGFFIFKSKNPIIKSTFAENFENA